MVKRRWFYVGKEYIVGHTRNWDNHVFNRLEKTPSYCGPVTSVAGLSYVRMQSLAIPKGVEATNNAINLKALTNCWPACLTCWAFTPSEASW